MHSRLDTDTIENTEDNQNARQNKELKKNHDVMGHEKNTRIKYTIGVPRGGCVHNNQR